MATVTAPAPPPIAEPKRAPEGRFFTDIEGLRGVAVGAVVLFHANVAPFMTGGFVGVDLFFVISGFLIQGCCCASSSAAGRIRYRGFYARRARRITRPPPAGDRRDVCGGVVCDAAAVGVPPGVRPAGRLAADGQLAIHRSGKGLPPTPLDDSVATHFWSLAVEEQFYFVWPLLIGGLAYMARRRGWSVRLVAGMGIAAVLAISLVLSLRLTASDPVMSYMATHTRAWQFGVGAMVAVAGPLLGRLFTWVWLRMAMWLVGWAGLVAVAIAR